MGGGLFSLLNSGFMGLESNTRRIKDIASNMSNAESIGYRALNTRFQSLMTQTHGPDRRVSYGVNAVQSREFSVGNFMETDNPENISLLREGFFPVLETEGAKRRVLTRAGDFGLVQGRYLRNSSGYDLLGWAYDESDDNLSGTYEERLNNGDRLTRVDVLDHIYKFKETKNVEVSFNLDSRLEPDRAMGLYESSRSFDFKNFAISSPQFSAQQNTIESIDLVDAGIFPGDKLTIEGTGLNDGEYTVVAYDSETGRVTVQENLQDEAYSQSVNIRHENQEVAGQGIMVEGLIGVTFDSTTNQMVAEGLMGADINVGDYLYIQDPNNSQNNRSYLVEAFDPVTGTVEFDNMSQIPQGFQELNVDIIQGNNKLLFHNTPGIENSRIEFISQSQSFRIPALSSLYIRKNDMFEIRTKSGTNDGFWVIDSFDSNNGQFRLKSRDDPQRIIEGEMLTNQDLDLLRYIPSRSGLGSVTENEINASELLNRVDAPMLSHHGDVHTISVVDKQGVAHDIKISFLKGTETNTWQVFLSSPDAYAESDVEGGTFHPKGVISFGTIVFEPDGSLSRDNSFMYVPDFIGEDGPVFERQSLEDFSSLKIVWSPDSTGASQAEEEVFVPQTIDNFDFTGLQQMATDFSFNNFNQDGMETDKMSSVLVDSQGWVKVQYSKGALKKIFKIPVVKVSDPSKLLAVSEGSTFLITDQVGKVTYDDVSNHNHVFQSGKIEVSNKSINDELNQIITYQQYFYSLQRLISTANELMEQVANLKN